MFVFITLFQEHNSKVNVGILKELHTVIKIVAKKCNVTET